MQEGIDEAYSALDELLAAVGNLSVNYISDRPPLHKALDEGHRVLDSAVRDGRYAPSINSVRRRKGLKPLGEDK